MANTRDVTLERERERKRRVVSSSWGRGVGRELPRGERRWQAAWTDVVLGKEGLVRGLEDSARGPVKKGVVNTFSRLLLFYFCGGQFDFVRETLYPIRTDGRDTKWHGVE